MSEHELLFEEAKNAVTKLFSDTSVPASQTIWELEEIIEDMETAIDAMRNDAADE
jgi:hypothetical protein